MIPVALDPSRLRIAVAGGGPASARRLAELRAAGAEPLPIPPEPAFLPPLDLLWIADLPPDRAAPLVAAAHAQHTLVNVEDQLALCDFRNVALLRRGDLLIAVSTNGQSPGLAAAVRDRIAALIGPEWAARTAALGARRRAWRAAGRTLPELARLTSALLARSGWLA